MKGVQLAKFKISALEQSGITNPIERGKFTHRKVFGKTIDSYSIHRLGEKSQNASQEIKKKKKKKPQYLQNSQQLASSVASTQSFSPSQRKLSGMQRVLLSHWCLHSCERLKQSSSSERSWHWGVPSHTCFLSIHILPWAHWNWSMRRHCQLHSFELHKTVMY